MWKELDAGKYNLMVAVQALSFVIKCNYLITIKICWHIKARCPGLIPLSKDVIGTQYGVAGMVIDSRTHMHLLSVVFTLVRGKQNRDWATSFPILTGEWSVRAELAFVLSGGTIVHHSTLLANLPLLQGEQSQWGCWDLWRGVYQNKWSNCLFLWKRFYS